jgi:hypothetical protein
MKESVFLFSILIFILVILIPFIFIWSLNTLFPILSIPYSWQTWLASFVLLGFYHGNKYEKK